MPRRIQIIQLEKLSEKMEEKFIKYTFKEYKEHITGNEHKSTYESLFKILMQVIKKIQDIPKGENEWIYHDCIICNATIIKIIKKSIDLFSSYSKGRTAGEINLNMIIDETFSTEFASRVDSNQSAVFTHLIDNVFKENIYPITHHIILEKRNNSLF